MWAWMLLDSVRKLGDLVRRVVDSPRLLARRQASGKVHDAMQLRTSSHFKLRPSAGHGARWQTSSADDAWAPREGAGDVDLDAK
jgi:hypothetical protein